MTGSTATPGSVSARRPLGRLLALALLVAGMLLLAGETVRRTIAHRYAERDPALALAWEPSDVSARENLANYRLGVAMGGASSQARASALREAEVAATRAFAAGPLHWAALRDLGIVASVEGDHRRALAIMARAALRSRRDIAVQGWWLEQALAAGDAPGAVTRIDAILRVDPTLEPRLFPVVAALMSAPAARPTWVRSLAVAPPWRDLMLSDLAARAADTSAVAGLFADLEARRSPVSDAQMGALLTRIANAGQYAEARALWTRSASPGAALSETPLFDGDFRGRAGSPPFNWRISQPASGAAAMEQRPGVGFALAAAYPSSAAPAIAEQLMTLAPGAYRLRGRWRVEQASSGAAMSWTLTCANSGVRLAEWRHGTDVGIDWTPFDLAFVVPPGCPAEWLRLAGRAGDGFGDVATAFSGLAVSSAEKPD